MSKKFFEAILGLCLLGCLAFGVLSVLSWVFHWSPLPQVSGAVLLNVGMGFLCLTGLMVIMKVPWDLHFEIRALLFEMNLSRERKIEVNPDREKYLLRMRWITLVTAIGAHIGAAAVIAGVTYWSQGQTGYYFAAFYLLATFFRPAHAAHQFLWAKLQEIRREVKYPRDDVISLVNDVRELKVQMEAVNEHLKNIESQLITGNETDRKLRSDLTELQNALHHTEQTFHNRMQMLSDEVERSMLKAVDNQDIVSGLRAFAKLIKQA